MTSWELPKESECGRWSVRVPGHRHKEGETQRETGQSISVLSLTSLCHPSLDTLSPSLSSSCPLLSPPIPCTILLPHCSPPLRPFSDKSPTTAGRPNIPANLLDSSFLPSSLFSSLFPSLLSLPLPLPMPASPSDEDRLVRAFTDQTSAWFGTDYTLGEGEDYLRSDLTARRFLIARSWDLEAALAMFKKHLGWRTESGINALTLSFDLSQDEKAAILRSSPPFLPSPFPLSPSLPPSLLLRRLMAWRLPECMVRRR